MTELQLVRAQPVAPVIERADDDTEGMPTVSVRFSPFDVWYEIDSYFEGRFLERTTKGAFADTMTSDRDSVKMQFDHGHHPSIGSMPIAPVEDLREDDDSAVAEGRMLDTGYNRELLPGLEAGVYGSSFRFRVLGDEWDEEPGASGHNPHGLPERTITKVRLYEAGPVTFPANPDATAGVRSMTDDWYAHIRSTDPSAYKAAVEARNQSPHIVRGSSVEDERNDGEPQTIGHLLAHRFAQRTR